MQRPALNEALTSSKPFRSARLPPAVLHRGAHATDRASVPGGSNANPRGLVKTEFGREGATMVVEEDGTYKASTMRGTLTQGTFYLRDGKLRYQLTRTTGRASLSEDQGKTVLTMMPVDPTADTGRTEYERVK